MRPILALFLLTIPLLSTSNDHNSDSIINNLKFKIQNSQSDTAKAKLLVELSEHLYLSNPDTMITLCQKAIEIIDNSLPQAKHRKKFLSWIQKPVRWIILGLFIMILEKLAKR